MTKEDFVFRSLIQLMPKLFEGDMAEIEEIVDYLCDTYYLAERRMDYVPPVKEVSSFNNEEPNNV